VTNPLGLTWQYTYDAAGRLVAETDFDDQWITYERDAAGRLERRVNPAGQSVGYTYDAMGRPVAKAVDGEITSYGYDAAGRLIRAAGPGCDLEWERDRAGRVVAERINGRSLASTYDAMGRRVERITPSGARVRYEYDLVGRPTSLNTSGHTFHFTHDAAGQELGRLIDDSLSVVQSWDAVGRLLEQQVTAAGQQVQRHAYGYGADHHLVRVEDALNGTTSLELDRMGRISGLQSPTRAENYAYNDGGHVTSAAWAGHEVAKEAEGDRQYSGTRLGRAGSVRYEYDAAGRVVVRRKPRLSRKADVWRTPVCI
jgi:YD repeat-containing protein